MVAKGMTRKELAAEVGVSIATIGRWITGLRAPAKHQTRLARVLGLTASDAEDAFTPTSQAQVRETPGRWKRYAQRYGAFNIHARDALAAGVVTEAMLDIATDRLGVHKGDGPTEAECRQAILDTIRRVDAWKRMATRDATEEDFGEDA